MAAATITAIGRVERGRLVVRQRSVFATRLRDLPDGDYTVTVRRRRATRSSTQNAWYWGGIVAELSHHTGFEPDEMHEVLKAKFLPKALAGANGNGVVLDGYVIGGSTTRLDKLAFGEYCEAIRRWSVQELGLVIPDPQAYEVGVA